MNDSGYTAVVGVRKHKAAPDSPNRFCVCKVPDGKFVDNAALVLYGSNEDSEFEKGVCVSDTIFVDDRTLELIRAVTNETAEIPEIKARIAVQWFTQKNVQS